MISTGRKEKMPNAYLIAANGFIAECFDSDEDGKDNDGGSGGGGESAEDGSSPTKKNRKRGNNRGLRKLLDIKKHVIEIESKYAVLAAEKGYVEFNRVAESVKRRFDDFDDDSLKRTREKKIMNSMMGNFGKNKTNHRTIKKREETIQPILDGYIIFRKFCLKKHIKHIKSEFKARGLEAAFENDKTTTGKLKVLQTNEQERLEREVGNALTSLNVVFVDTTTKHTTLKTKLALLKQAIIDNENCDIDWNDFNVGINKYFKKQSNEISDSTNFQ